MTRRRSLGAAALILMVIAWPALPSAAVTLVVEAEEIHTVSGSILVDGVIVIEDGRIRRVGTSDDVRIPADAEWIRAKIVTPGLIDAHSSVGLAGLYNVPADQDQDETTGPNQAGLRALDGFNPDEPLMRYLLEHGVTLVQTGPGPANPIAGQTGVFRTHGKTADEMSVRFPSGVLFNLGETPKSTYGSKHKFPSTRMGTAALIRKALQEASDYQRKRAVGKGDKGKRPDHDLGKEALGRLLRREIPAIFTAHREDDILTALRIAEEFHLDCVLAGATEGYLVIDPIRQAGVPVLVGPIMERISSPESMNATFENAAFLSAAGIPLAIRSGNESYVPKARLVLFEAAIAAANGLGKQAALKSITLDAARILGVERRHGSIEAGKTADLVLFDGDPFEYATHVEAVIAAGEIVYRR